MCVYVAAYCVAAEGANVARSTEKALFLLSLTSSFKLLPFPMQVIVAFNTFNVSVWLRLNARLESNLDPFKCHICLVPLVEFAVMVSDRDTSCDCEPYASLTHIGPLCCNYSADSKYAIELTRAAG